MLKVTCKSFWAYLNFLVVQHAMRAFPNHVMYNNFGQLDIFQAYKLDCFISWFEETKQWSSEGLVLVSSDRLATMMPNELGPQFLHSRGFSIGICKVGKCWQFANPNTITVLSNPIFILPHPSHILALGSGPERGVRQLTSRFFRLPSRLKSKNKAQLDARALQGSLRSAWRCQAC